MNYKTRLIQKRRAKEIGRETRREAIQTIIEFALALIGFIAFAYAFAAFLILIQP